MTKGRIVADMTKKSDEVRRLVAAGEYKAALRIAKDFRIGISKSDSDDMKMAYDCLTHPSFYKSIGVDLNNAQRKGIEVVQRIYGT